MRTPVIDLSRSSINLGSFHPFSPCVYLTSYLNGHDAYVPFKNFYPHHYISHLLERVDGVIYLTGPHTFVGPTLAPKANKESWSLVF